VDAISEFIDNAIQACKGVTPVREITVSLFLEKKENFLMIADNGKGLNISEIQAFATFSLDQETRRNQYFASGDQNSSYSTFSDVRDPSYISKFGVGSKQAGFYLGDRITVLSKPRNENKIYKFTLSGQEFSKRYESKKAVYDGKVLSFPSKNRFNEFFEEEDVENRSNNLNQEIEEHMRKFSKQSAIFIIKLHDHIVRTLLENKSRRLPLDLGEMYYFHLHPEHSLQGLMTIFENSLMKEANMKILSICQASTSYGSSELADLSLFYKEFRASSSSYTSSSATSSGTSIKINNCPNYISLCIDRAADIFLFQLSIPDSKSSSDELVRKMTFKCVFLLMFFLLGFQYSRIYFILSIY
jgi:hypothetical protein